MMLDQLAFKEMGLLPTVVQEAAGGQVLMLAYSSPESLRKTLETGEAWFYSRSREELWHKGSTSGNRLLVEEVRYDCDGDALLFRVTALGPACHTGETSCFFRGTGAEASDGGDSAAPAPADGGQGSAAANGGATGTAAAAPDAGLGILEGLYHLVQERRRERPAGSYMVHLLDAGRPRMLQKVGEEAVETVVAGMDGQRQRIVEETADLLFHLTVFLGSEEIPWSEIAAELAARRR